jgi:hypothetical protein
MTESGSGISFDRAAYVDAGPRQACGMCRRPLGSEYWKWYNKVLCESCRGRAAALVADSQSPATFARAALLGGGTALGCGIAYAFFATFAGRWALVTIGIGYLVARVVRKASHGIGGVQYQVLATVLTYFASAMAYPPTMVQDLEDIFSAPSYLLHTLLELPLAPIAAMTHYPLNGLIIGFGLWEAWRMTRGVATTVEGPFRAAAPAPEALPQQTSSP